jgi:hypothetical protein
MADWGRIEDQPGNDDKPTREQMEAVILDAAAKWSEKTGRPEEEFLFALGIEAGVLDQARDEWESES